MAFDPDEFLRSSPGSISPKPKAAFDPDAFLNSSPYDPPAPPVPAPVPATPVTVTPSEAEPSRPSKLESAGRGALDMISMGFADELTGAVESIFTDKKYEQARDESRAAFKAAKEENPKSYFAGQVGGGIASALIPGGLVAKGALAGTKGATLAAGAMGGLQALGDSESTSPFELAKDTAIGSVVGAGIGRVAHIAGNALMESMPVRYGKMFIKEMTTGATPTAAKRFAEVKDIAPDVLAGDKLFMRAARSSPEKAQEIAKARLKDLGEGVGKIYDDLDDKAGMVPLIDVKRFFEAESEKLASQPGMETVRDAVTRTGNNFVVAFTRNGEHPLNVDVQSQEVRRWVTRLLKQNQSSIGSLNEHEAFQLKSQVFEVGNDFLRKYLDKVEVKVPELGPEIAKLRQMNKQIAVWASTDELLVHKIGKEYWKSGGIVAALKTAGLAGLGASLASTDHALVGAATGAGIVGGAKVVKLIDRGVTRKLAQLVEAAKKGNVNAQMLKEAIEVGVPAATVNTFAGLIRNVRPQRAKEE